MKKLLVVVAALVIVFSLSACSQEEYKVAMITDVGGIDDESFNQGTYEGIQEFCDEEGLSYKYYKPLGDNPSDQEYLDAIELAIEGGAEIIFTPGYLFGNAVNQAQTEYPDVYFVILDAVPDTIEDNTLPIMFNEHESGFLAGYSAVIEGYRHLGFTGGIAVPAVVKFGVGYVAGAYYAADELGATITLGDDEYTYFGNFDATDTNKALAAGWYNSGVEIIFSAAGGAGSSVISAATEASGDAVVIGVDVDQSGKGSVVLTSAMKRLAVAVQTALQDYVDGDFQGGETIVLGTENDGVGLPMDTSRFDNFTQAEYDAIYALLEDGTITVPTNHSELVTFLDALDTDYTNYPSADTIVPPSE